MTRSEHKTSFSAGRIAVAMVAVILASGAVGYRLFALATTQHDYYLKTAKQQYENPSALLAGRGDIFFSDSRTGENTLAATNKKNGAVVTRTYARNTLAAQAIGFVGFRGHARIGQYGVEEFYDDVLKTGDDIVLTIDPNIQSYVENTLNTLLKKYSSPLGTIIVEDPKTGAILAMASSPSFDPNNYQQSPLSRYVNPAVQSVFEPGSSFKPFTMSAALDSGAVTPDTIYTDPGEVKIGNYTIYNYDKKSHGLQTMTEALEHY